MRTISSTARLLSMALLAGLWAAPAAAQIDVTGRWKVTQHETSFGFTYETLFSLVQTGSVVTVEPPSAYSGGTIDPVSGALHLDGQGSCGNIFTGEVIIIPWSIDAVVAADGQTFTGTFRESIQPTRSCFNIGGPLEAVRLPATCGNGVVDDGEQCDEGASGGACCTGLCTPRPSGWTCTSDGAACTAGASCDGAGACVQHVKPAGALCRFAENACDTAEVCDGVSSSCPPPTSPTEPDVDDDGILDGCDFCLGGPLEKVTLRFGSFQPGRKDFLKLRAGVRLPPGTPFHNPQFKPEFLAKAVTLRDATGRAIVSERIPGTTISGPPFEWKRKGTRWTFINHGTTLTQVARMQMGPSRRDPNVWDVRVAIPEGVLPDDAGPPPYAVEVELYRTGFPSEDCGRTVLGLPGSPAPRCAAPNARGVISCR